MVETLGRSGVVWPPAGLEVVQCSACPMRGVQCIVNDCRALLYFIADGIIIVTAQQAARQ